MLSGVVFSSLGQTVRAWLICPGAGSNRPESVTARYHIEAATAGRGVRGARATTAPAGRIVTQWPLAGGAKSRVLLRHQ
jgi:hypothetical protein